VGNIYQYDSAGLYNENQLITNFNIRMGPALSLFGYYTLSYADTNAAGGSFPMNQYNLAQSYGNAPWATRNRFFVGGSVSMPYGFSFSPFLVVTSGHPYNITLGKDLNGDSIFNDRPAVASTLCPTCVDTSLGYFNTQPVIGEQLVAPYYLYGPGQFSMNARLSKTFGFGKETEGGGGGGGFHRHGHGLGGRGLSSGGGGRRFGGGSDRRYQLEVGMMVHNVFNKVNLGTPVGNITSTKYFGKSNSLAGGFFGNQSANRMVNFFMRFSF